MTDSPTLDTLISVSPRFARSVSLARDAGRADALDGYIFTPTGRDVLRRLAEAMRGESPTRAWSLTGPYGSGKSAFALFAAQLLAGEEEVRSHARKFLVGADTELSERLFGAGASLPKKTGRLCPVLVTGSRHLRALRRWKDPYPLQPQVSARGEFRSRSTPISRPLPHH